MVIDRVKLRKIREERGYSLRELAEKSGVDYTSLHRWESLDTARPYPKNVKKVAKALSVDPCELQLGETNTVNSNKGFQPILEWLNYWINIAENEPACAYSGNEYVHDIYRALNDFDCVMTHGNLMADTIFSVWYPLKMVLECLNFPQKFYKENKYGEKTLFLRDIRENINTYLQPHNATEKELIRELLVFAKESRTRANVMILPNRAMQKRGNDYLDQMPRTLYECFEGGVFHKYFQEYTVEEWVREERLEIFFRNGEVKRREISPLIDSMEASEVKWLTTSDELRQMLKRYNKILQWRSTFYCCH